MRSLPASQLADDGEADGTPVPPAYDPSSEEPLPHKDGVRKSVGPAPDGSDPNALATLIKSSLGWTRGRWYVVPCVVLASSVVESNVL